MINKTEYKTELSSLKETTGQLGFKIGSRFAKQNFIPLTTYLLNDLWKAKNDDSTVMSFSKTAARALTYVFTAITLAPIYQFLFYGLPKRLLSIKQHNDFAKQALVALSNYNDLRHKISKEADHEINYLSPENVHNVNEQLQASGRIEVTLTPENQAKVKNKLDLLEKEKKAYDKVIDTQVKEIVIYLRGLSSEDRLQAHRDILGTFMTHVGFGDEFIRDDERLTFALDISNKIGDLLIETETKKLVENLTSNYNFIQFNQSLAKLSLEIATVFGIENDVATTLVACGIKKEITNNFTSLSKFSKTSIPRLSDICTREDRELQVLLDSVKHHYLDTVTALNTKYEDLENSAILADALQGLVILNKDVKSLINEEKQLTKDLVTINGKLKALAQRKQHYNFSKIHDTIGELEDQRNAKTTLLAVAGSKVAEKSELLRAINNRAYLDFNGPEVQALKAIADETLEKERALEEGKLNLGPQNIRAYRAFFTLLKGIDDKKTAEAQATKISALTANLYDQRFTFETYAEKVGRALGFGVKAISLIDTLRINLETIPYNESVFRDSVRSLYESMTDCQKAYFAQEVSKHLRTTRALILKGDKTQAGKKHLEDFINRKSNNADPILAAIRSQEGKAAAEYTPFTPINNWWWKEKVTTSAPQIARVAN